MGNPLISVVMAVYNNEKLFPRAVKSVLSQEYNDIELIVVDDGSTDNTSYIADQFAEADKRVKVLHQQNQWIYASFNNGIKMASGKYIYIVNSDDLLFENALGILAENVIRYNYPDVIWTKVIRYECNEVGKVIDIRDFSKEANNKVYYKDINKTPQEWVESIIKNAFMGTQANLYKKELMIRHPFRIDWFSADTFFNYEVATDIKSCLILDEPIYRFNSFADGRNASAKYYSYQNDMYNKLFDIRIRFLTNKGISTTENIEFFKRKRRIDFSYECRLILNNSKWSFDRKVQELLIRDYHDMLSRAFSDSDGKEEFEARLFSEVKKFFDKNLNLLGIEEYKNHFIYKLLESLLRYEKDDEDWENIRKGIYNEHNPNRIGEQFYKKLCGENK